MRLLEERIRVSVIVGALVLLAACVPAAVGIGVGVSLVQASPTVNQAAHKLADRVAERIIQSNGRVDKIRETVCALPAPVRLLVRARVLERSIGRINTAKICDTPEAPADPAVLDSVKEPKTDPD